jgi:phage protein D
MSDGDIAEKILRELPSASLTLDADATPDQHEYVIQYNQTDLAFLLERASLIGFSVWVDDRTLNFKRATPEEAAVQTLVWGHPAAAFAPGEHLPLGSFTPTMNTLRPVTKVTVQGYDQKQAQRFEASAPEVPSPSAGQSAADVSAAAGRNVETVVVDQPLESADEARRLARALYERASLEFITGTGATIGSPDLRAGKLVALQGLGPVFDGTYSVTQSTHTISSAGYRTTFSARKAALG